MFRNELKLFPTSSDIIISLRMMYNVGASPWINYLWMNHNLLQFYPSDKPFNDCYFIFESDGLLFINNKSLISQQQNISTIEHVNQHSTSSSFNNDDHQIWRRRGNMWRWQNLVIIIPIITTIQIQHIIQQQHHNKLWIDE